MTRDSYDGYRRRFMEAANAVLAAGRSDVLSEAAFPAYTNPNPLMNFLFWQRLRRVIRKLEADGPYRSVLDFGTGGGVMLPFLGGISDEVVGVDVDLSPFRQISAHMQFPGNVKVLDLHEQPLSKWRDGVFDAILALDVLEHVPELAATVAEFGRLLAPGGLLVASGPTESFLYRIGRKLAGREYSGHYHVRNIYDIKRELQRTFDVSVLATLYYPFPLFQLYNCRKEA